MSQATPMGHPPDAAQPGPGAGAAKPPTLGARDAFLAALWFGLAAGLLEAIAVPVRRHFRPATVTFDRDIVLMIPAAECVYFAALGLLLVVALKALPRLVSPRTAVFLLSFVGYAGVAFQFAPLLATKPALILAGGLAFQTSRVAAARFAGFMASARRTLPWFAGSAALLFAWMLCGVSLREWNANRGLPDAPKEAPNVLLIVMDTARAQSTSVHGYERDTTPNLVRLAAEAVRFDNAVAPSPWTLPTHASLFTGRQPHEVGVGWIVPLDGKYPTLGEILAAKGYATAGFAANRFYCGHGTGLERGFARYDAFGTTWGLFFNSPALVKYAWGWIRPVLGHRDYIGRASAATISGAFLGWMPQDRPFFVFLNYYDAHQPYMPPPPYDRMFGVAPREGAKLDERIEGPYDAADLEAMKSQYDGGIAYLDHELGLLFDELRARGVLEKTLVIVTSDHGEEFAEHGVLGHGGTLYMPSLRVPLVIAPPARAGSGRVVSQPVAVRDVGATILDVAGFDEELPRFAGRSLAGHWGAGPAPAAEPILSELESDVSLPKWWPVGPGALRGVVAGGFHYIRSEGGRPEELYDLTTDPAELHDLAAVPEHAATLERCRKALAEMMPR